MISGNFVKNNFDLVQKSLVDRGIDFDLDSFLKKYDSLNLVRAEIDSLRSLQNQSSKRLTDPAIKQEEKLSLLQEMKIISENIQSKKTTFHFLEKEQGSLSYLIPNILDPMVPIGSKQEDNVVIKNFGIPEKFTFPIKDHIDLGLSCGIFDVERASKISGARFSILRGKGASLERALIQFFLENALKSGYQEVSLPFLVKRDSVLAAGQLPKFEVDLFVTKDDRFLIPTAEVPMISMHSEEIFEEKSLPIRLVSHTPCFRSEAGSAGKDIRGLIRQHQFHKVEIVSIVKSEDSEEEHSRMLSFVESLLQKLELPYRILLLCSGDIGFSAKKCYDVEVWLPSQNRYVEISSISNCGDFQSRRGKIRYKSQSGKNELLHTLNGSALAVGRTICAVFENFQMSDGSIKLPEVLWNYMGTKKLDSKKNY